MSSNEQIRVHVHGAQGRMGQACVQAVQGAADMEFVGGTDFGDDLAGALASNRPDVVIEFTVPSAVEQNVRTMLEAGLPVVAGTTVERVALLCPRPWALEPGFKGGECNNAHAVAVVQIFLGRGWLRRLVPDRASRGGAKRRAILSPR